MATLLTDNNTGIGNNAQKVPSNANIVDIIKNDIKQIEEIAKIASKSALSNPKLADQLKDFAKNAPKSAKMVLGTIEELVEIIEKSNISKDLAKATGEHLVQIMRFAKVWDQMTEVTDKLFKQFETLTKDHKKIRKELRTYQELLVGRDHGLKKYPGLFTIANDVLAYSFVSGSGVEGLKKVADMMKIMQGTIKSAQDISQQVIKMSFRRILLRKGFKNLSYVIEQTISIFENSQLKTTDINEIKNSADKLKMMAGALSLTAAMMNIIAISLPGIAIARISLWLLAPAVDKMVDIMVDAAEMSESIKEGAKILLVMTAALSVVVLALNFMTKVNMLAVLGAVLVMSAALFIAMFVFESIGKRSNTDDIVNGSINIIIIATAMAATAAALALVSMLVKGIDFLAVIGFLAIVAAMVYAFVVVGSLLATVSEFIFLMAGVMLVVVGTILVMSFMIKKLAEVLAEIGEINIDTDKVTDSVTGIVGAAVSPLKSLNEVSLIDVMTATAKVFKLMKISIYIGWMARILRNLAQLKVVTGYDSKGKPTSYEIMKPEDFKNAAMNAAGILTFFVNLFDDSKDSHTLKVLGSTITMTPIKAEQLNKISKDTVYHVRKLRRIVAVVGRMAKLLRNLSQLKIATEYDSKGNPIKFENMKAEDFKNAALNAAGILTFFINLFDDSKDSHTLKVLGSTITMTPIKAEQLNKISKDTVYHVRKLRRIVNIISSIAKVLANMSQLKIAEEYDSKGNPTKFYNMQAGDFKNAALNAAGILTFFVNLFDDSKNSHTLKVLGSTINMTPIKESQLEGVTKSMQFKIWQLKRIVSNIGDMADTLKDISQLKIATEYNDEGKPKGFVNMSQADFSNAALNAAGILKFFVALFDDSKTSHTFNILGSTVTLTPIKESQIEKIQGSTKRKIKKLSTIVGCVGNMAETMANMAKLVVPDEDAGYTEDGRPKNWKAIGKPDFDKASENIDKIMTFMVDAVVASATKVENTRKKDMGKVEMAMKAIEPVSNTISTILEIINGRYPSSFDAEGNPTAFVDFNERIKSFKYTAIGLKSNEYYPGMTGIKYMMRDMMAVGIDAIGMIDEKSIKSAQDKSKKLQQPMEMIGNMISNVSSITSDNANSYKIAMQETRDMLKSVNTVNLDKLKYAYSLAKSLADLSKSVSGNFEGLAKAINENIVTVLKELKTVLEEVNGTIAERDTAKPVTSLAQATSGNKVNNPPKPGDKKKDAATKITSESLKEVASKIEELIDQLSSSKGIAVRPAPNSAWAI